ncbi:unnamed protein product [Auanema sp. JU1783]|nr:unnamed protein product [Auanema sp. JU1783]
MIPPIDGVEAELYISPQSTEGVYYIVEAIVGVDLVDGEIKYKIRWQNYSEADDTYEPESHFRYEPVLSRMMDEFQAAHADKLQSLKEQIRARAMNRRRQRASRRSVGYIVEDLPDPADITVSREPEANDSFYGTTFSGATGELKKLIDPSHKNSSTERILAFVNSERRVTRRQMKSIIPSVLGNPPSNRESVEPSSTSSEVSEEVVSDKALSDNVVSDKAKRTLRLSAGKDTIPKRRRIDNDKSSSREPEDVEEDQQGEQRTDGKSQGEDIVEIFSVIRSPGPNLENPKDSQSVKKEGNRSADKISLTEEKSKSTQKKRKSKPETSAKVEQIPVLIVSRSEISDGSDFSWDDLQTELPPANLPITNSENELTPMFLNSLIREGEPYRVLAVLRFLKAEDKAPGLYHNFIRWTNLDTGFTLLHTLCAYVKCYDSHAGDDYISFLCDNSTYGNIIDYQEKSNLYTALHFCVENGAICRVARLLGHGCAINFPDRNGITPLRLAYRKNHAKMMKLLLQQGANFAKLEQEERRKAPEERKKRAYEALQKHCEQLRDLLQAARFRLFRNVIDINESTFQCPIVTFPCSEGPVFLFPYNIPSIDVPNDTYMFLLFVYVCNFQANDAGKYTCRCWPELSIRCEINSKSLEPVQKVKYPMIYYAANLKDGENYVRVELLDKTDLNSNVLAIQLAMIKRSEEILFFTNTTWSANSGLEVAPLVGPMF